MISVEGRWIFIHPTKTAGTSVSSVLLPFSDDHAVAEPGGGRVGLVGTFEVQGPMTPHKHVPLRRYAEVLGDDLARFRVLTTLRHPVPRMVSDWLHARRWLRPRVRGAHWLVARYPRLDSPRWHQPLEPVWDVDGFEAMVRSTPTQSAMLRRPDGTVVEPDWVLDLADPAASMARLSALLDLDLDELPRANPGSHHRLAAQMLADPQVHRVVLAHHGEDLERWPWLPAPAAAAGPGPAQ